MAKINSADIEIVGIIKGILRTLSREEKVVLEACILKRKRNIFLDLLSKENGGKEIATHKTNILNKFGQFGTNLEPLLNF